jgi:hypothetical protein
MRLNIRNIVRKRLIRCYAFVKCLLYRVFEDLVWQRVLWHKWKPVSLELTILRLGQHDKGRDDASRIKCSSVLFGQIDASNRGNTI